MTSPARIQRRRTKGWRMPEGAVYVGRPGVWGNPFDHPDRKAAVRAFRRYAQVRLAEEPTWLDPLRGAAALACWCPVPGACHADVLIELLGRVA